MNRRFIYFFIICVSLFKIYGQDKNLAWMKSGSLEGVYHVSISPDNKYLLSVSPSNAKIFSIEKASLIKIIPNKFGYPVVPYVFSSNGSLLYYSDSTSIKCIDLGRDTIIKVFTDHKGYVYGISLSLNGQILLSSASDSCCIMRQLSNDSMQKIIKMPQQIYSVNFLEQDKTFLADGWGFSYIVDVETGRIIKKIKSSGFSQSSNYNLIAFDTKNIWGTIVTEKISVYNTRGKLIKNHLFNRKNEQCTGFCLTPDGKYLVTLINKSIKIYDSKSGKLHKTIKGDFNTPIAVSPNNKWITVNTDYSNDSLRKLGIIYISAVAVIYFESGKSNLILPADQYWLRPPSFSVDNRFLATTDLQVWDINSGKLVNSFANHNSNIKNIIASNKNNFVASLSELGEVIVWEKETGKKVCKFKHENNVIKNIDFTEDGKKIVAYSNYESDYTTSSNYMNFIQDSLSITFWNAETGKLEKEINLKATEYHSVAISPDRNKLFLFNDDKIKIFDLYSKELLNVISLPDNYYDVIYSPQKNYLGFEGFPEGKLTIYDIDEGKLLFDVQAHVGFVRTVSWSNNEKILVSSGQDDNSLKVWEMPEGKLLKTFKLDKPRVHYGSVSPDGKYFAGSSNNGYVFIWELGSGIIIRSFQESPNYIWCVIWSSDGKFVFEGDSDGNVIAWKTNLY